MAFPCTASLQAKALDLGSAEVENSLKKIIYLLMVNDDLWTSGH